MNGGTKGCSIILGGGGVKGVAHVGALTAAEQMGYRFIRVGGVSAGAMVASLVAAGYSMGEIYLFLKEFDFKKVINRKNRIRSFLTELAVEEWTQKLEKSLKDAGRQVKNAGIEALAASIVSEGKTIRPAEDGIWLNDYRAGLLSELVNIAKYGGIYDGDYLEEWLREKLLAKGVRNFGDLFVRVPGTESGGSYACHGTARGNGFYRLRVTAADATRGKTLYLPEDIADYGINPDELDVARAVRMSVSVPYFFRPVKLEYQKDGKKKICNIVDGGLLNKFPGDLLNSPAIRPVYGFVLSSSSSARIDFNYPINTIKGLLGFLWQNGDADYSMLDGVVDIDASGVHWLNFNLSEQDIRKLYDSGYAAGIRFFNAKRLFRR